MSDKLEKILILGGTKEATSLATELVGQGHDVTTSLAGRTKEPRPVCGKVRIGGFGGVEGLIGWLEEHQITKLIDATHPFASQISRHALDASNQAGISLEVHTRQPWEMHKGDVWHDVSDLQAAVGAIPSDARVLLALGSQHIAPFSERDDVYFVIRMVDEPQTPLPFVRRMLIPGRPSARWEEEAELLKAQNITHIVCRNSGGRGAYGKIEAARNLQIPVIMIARPAV